MSNRLSDRTIECIHFISPIQSIIEHVKPKVSCARHFLLVIEEKWFKSKTRCPLEEIIHFRRQSANLIANFFLLWMRLLMCNIHDTIHDFQILSHLNEYLTWAFPYGITLPQRKHCSAVHHQTHHTATRDYGKKSVYIFDSKRCYVSNGQLSGESLKKCKTFLLSRK